jgi:predicted NUDIX family NTP pyrophosphohydrolase
MRISRTGVKMPRVSAGLLTFKRVDGELQVFLVHPGGPFWRNKDFGSWSIPKGEVRDDEDALCCARREFAEETGQKAIGDFISLGEVRQAGGKIVKGWAVEGDCSDQVQSNKFSMEWPPHSGRRQEFAEVDKAAWFSLRDARRRMNRAQTVFLDRLAGKLRD